MSYHSEAFKKQQADDAAAREEMIKRNLQIMDEQAKARPEPSIEDVQRATAPKQPRVAEAVNVEESTINNDGGKADGDKVEKTSTAEQPGGGKYKTRELNAKK